jgi:hypothetical protein
MYCVKQLSCIILTISQAHIVNNNNLHRKLSICPWPFCAGLLRVFFPIAGGHIIHALGGCCRQEDHGVFHKLCHPFFPGPFHVRE